MLIAASNALVLWQSPCAIPHEPQATDLIRNGAEAALMAERDIMQRKAAMGSMNAGDLRTLREHLRLDI